MPLLRMPNKARNTSPGNLPARNLLDPCRRPTEGDACGQRSAAGWLNEKLVLARLVSDVSFFPLFKGHMDKWLKYILYILYILLLYSNYPSPAFFHFCFPEFWTEVDEQPGYVRRVRRPHLPPQDQRIPDRQPLKNQHVRGPDSEPQNPRLFPCFIRCLLFIYIWYMYNLCIYVLSELYI